MVARLPVQSSAVEMFYQRKKENAMSTHNFSFRAHQQTP